MPSFAERISASYNAMREAWIRPENQKVNNSHAIRREVYNRNWQYYTNEAFEELVMWAAYLSKNGLYDYTRLLYNPFRRLVDFYAGRVYPGRLSKDGEEFPDGKKLAIPFSMNVKPEMKRAIAQLWQWSNFEVQKSLLVRFGAIAGNYLHEIVDDVEGGKVRFELTWPGLVDPEFLILDAVGNVKQYAVEFETTDPVTNEDYTYRKEVTQKEIITKRDGELWAPEGRQPRVPNPYGFCPAVWVKHKDLGGDAGVSCMHGNFTRLDELNSVATHGLDLIHKTIDPAVIFWGTGSIVSLLKSPVEQDEAAQGAGYDVRRDVQLWQGPQGGQAQNVISTLDWTGFAAEVDRLQEEFNTDYPELTFFTKLREMTQVTGPAVRGLVGDAEAPYDDACGNYDSGNERLFEMGVAIAGFRAQEKKGGWAKETEQQKKFLGFNLESYEEDNLTVEILPRQLLPLSEYDEIDLKSKKFGLANSAQGLLPSNEKLELIGVDEDKRAEVASRLAKEEGMLNDPERDQ